MRYVLQWYYASEGVGPYEAGAVVDLADTMAAWINRDSPGTLVAEKPERAYTQPAHDRMVRDATLVRALTGQDEGGAVTYSMASRSIASLGLSTRSVSALAGAGLKWAVDVREASDDDLLSLRGIGRKALATIRAATVRRGA